MEEVKLREAEQKKDDTLKQTSVVEGTDKEEEKDKNHRSLTSKSSSAEQDLDTFLLGDLEDSDGGPGIQLILLAFYLWPSSRIHCQYTFLLATCNWDLVIILFSVNSRVSIAIHCLSDEGEESFDDDFDKIDNSVSSNDPQI